MFIRPETWLSILKSEYFDYFLPIGGSAFKLACCMDDVDAVEIGMRVVSTALDANLATVSLDAATCKLHMCEQLFYQIARGIDWDALARNFLEQLLKKNGYRIPAADTVFSMRNLAALNERDERELRRDIKKWLEQDFYKDREMMLEFRIAMIRLIISLLDRECDDSSHATYELIQRWLKGDLRLISSLKQDLIFTKINRWNARNMIKSLAHFCRLAGRNGLCLHLDISRYYTTQKPVEPDGTFFYSKSALLDLYELLRQFIDATDRNRHFMIIVTSGMEPLQSEKRGIDAYMALRDRLMDDVHDKHRANPMASVVRLAHCGTPYSYSTTSDRIGDQHLPAIGAIEALRSGVPNQFAVQALGADQPTILSRYSHQLNALQAQPRHQAEGIMISAGFGGGKSHLLEHLEHVAMQRNVVCSRIVISKETPLFDPDKLFQAAIAGMHLPNNHCSGVAEIASRLDPNSDSCLAFEQWMREGIPSISERFAATYWIFMHLRAEPDIMDQMVRFWSGTKFTDGALKKILRSYRQGQTFRFAKMTREELAFQRFRFVSQLIIAAGYSGWALLIDEAELIGRYSLMQRARSYGMIARLLGHVPDFKIEGLTSVIAITNDFPAAILEDKNDLDIIPQRLSGSEIESTKYLAGIARRAMQLIQKDSISLRQPSDDAILNAYSQIRTLHSDAYRWSAPDIGVAERLSSSRMREFVKSWITQWDLSRFDPAYSVEMETSPHVSDYSEDDALETPVEQTPDSNES